MRPFRFALQASSAPDGASWRNLARKTESLGYSTLFLPDHFNDQIAPLVGLTVAAEATTVLKVGTLVLGNDYRHPLVLAREIATLDMMTGGRVEFGLGAGWMRSDYAQAGLAYDEPKVRVDRLEEALQVMQGIWSGEPFDFSGDHYQISQAVGHPRPYGSGHPVLLIGGGSPRVLGIAARNANIVGINPNLASGEIGPSMIASAAAELVDKRIEWVAEAAGERMDQIELQSLTFFVQIGENGRQLRENLGSALGFDEEQVSETPSALIGSKQEIIEKLQKSRERWGLSYWVVHEPEMDEFADIVARLDGT